MGMDTPRQGKKQVSASGGDWYVGQTVRHPKFGYGTVLSFEGEGPQARIQINFEQAGSKWLVVQYARLEAV